MSLMNAEGFFEDGGYDYVRFEQTDLHGMSRSQTITTRNFQRFAESGVTVFGGLLGLDAQGDLVSGLEYLDESAYGDHVMWPDPRTLSAVPWIPKTARVLAEPSWQDGTPVSVGPRFIMRQMVQRLSDAGFVLRSTFEYDLYLVDRLSLSPAFEGKQLYWSLSNDFDGAFMVELLDTLSSAAVDVLSSNAANGPGQLRITYAATVGVNAADQAFTFKNAVKEIARKHGYTASFMTMPYSNENPSSGHFQYSLLERRGGANVFADEASPDGLSRLSKWWVGGQIKHTAALSAICSPTVNCFRRYRTRFAPSRATWGYEDTTSSLRVRGARTTETQIESRLPASGSNPYLVAAAVMAAGLDGIVCEEEPPEPSGSSQTSDLSAPLLPASLDAALDALMADTVLHEYLGREFVQLFVCVKRHEIEKARASEPAYGTDGWSTAVTEWERENLFNYL